MDKKYLIEDSISPKTTPKVASLWLHIFLICIVSIFAVLILAAIFLDGVFNDPTISYKDCGSNALVTNLTLSDCTTQPCSMTRGREYTIDLSAILQTPSADFLPYEVTAWGRWWPYWPTFDLLLGDACTQLIEGACPLKFGQNFTYKIKIIPKITLPVIQLTVRALMRDNQGNKIICGDVDVNLH